MSSTEKSNALNCAQCDVAITTKYMKCSVCSACYHFSPCCSIQLSSYNGMNIEKRAAWRCHKCRERKNSAYHIVISDTVQHKQKRNSLSLEDDEIFEDSNKRFKDHVSTNNQQQQTPVHHELHNVIQHKEQQKLQQPQIQTEQINESIQIMMQNMSQMALQLSAISTQIQNQQETLQQIHENQFRLSDQVTELQKQNEQKDKKIREMENKISKLEQKTIEKNIEINNLNNDSMSAATVVKKLAEKLNVQIDEPDIEKVYHTKGKAKVVLELSSLHKKRELMSKIEGHRVDATDINIEAAGGKHQYIYVNDQLTAEKRHLLWLAKRKAKEAGWKFVWVRQGEILARKVEKSVVVTVNNESDIELIC